MGLRSSDVQLVTPGVRGRGAGRGRTMWPVPDLTRFSVLFGGLLLMGVIILALRWTWGSRHEPPDRAAARPRRPHRQRAARRGLPGAGPDRGGGAGSRLTAAGIRATVRRDDDPAGARVYRILVFPDDLSREGRAQPGRPRVARVPRSRSAVESAFGSYTRWYLASKKQNTPYAASPSAIAASRIIPNGSPASALSAGSSPFAFDGSNRTAATTTSTPISPSATALAIDPTCPSRSTHLPRVPVRRLVHLLQELLLPAVLGLHHRDGQDPQPHRADQELAARPAEHARRRLLPAAAGSAAPRRVPAGQDRQREEDRGPGPALHPLLDLLLGVLHAARRRRPPAVSRHSATATNPTTSTHSSTRPNGCAAIVWKAPFWSVRSSAIAERHLQRQPRDEQVRDPVRDEPDPRTDLDRLAVGCPAGGPGRLACGPGGGLLDAAPRGFGHRTPPRAGGDCAARPGDSRHSAIPTRGRITTRRHRTGSAATRSMSAPSARRFSTNRG